jgi:hypothetical protein
MTSGWPARLAAEWMLVEIPTSDGQRGALCVVEGNGNVPFSIERVYWIHNIPSDALRGCHSHRTVQELIVAVAGEFTVHCDNGVERDTIRLDDPARGLLIGSGVWREVDMFSPGSVCLVLASGPYDEDEYVRDYETFNALAHSRRLLDSDFDPRSHAH